MTNYRKSIITACSLSAVSTTVLYFIQNQSNKIVRDCSYLDPITIDILAFMAGFFLVIEGFCDIKNHQESPVNSQLTRCVRICFGFCVIIIHILQVLHK